MSSSGCRRAVPQALRASVAAGAKRAGPSWCLARGDEAAPRVRTWLRQWRSGRGRPCDPPLVLLSPPSCGSPCTCTAYRSPCPCFCCPPGRCPCCATTTRCTRTARTSSSSADGLLWQRQHRNDSGSSDWSCCCRRHCGAVCVHVDPDPVVPVSAGACATEAAQRRPVRDRWRPAAGRPRFAGMHINSRLCMDRINEA